jgi:hypothetical protein
VVRALPTHTDKALFVDLMIEGLGPSSGVTSSELRAWVDALRIPFSAAFDVDPSSSFTIRSMYGVKETTYIVERTTMKIVAKASTPQDGLTALAALP